MTISNYSSYTQTPYNSPILTRIIEKPGHEADESESDEEIYASIDDKEERRGISVPILIPPRKQPIQYSDTWNIVQFGD